MNAHDMFRKFAAAPRSGNEIVPMDTFGGGAADYLSPGAFGGRRAGRSTQMAYAAGEKPGLNVEHPLTNELLWGVPAAALGGIAGAGINHAVGGSASNVPIAGAVGGSAAALLTALLLRYKRRQRMGEINTAWDKKRSKGALKKSDPALSSVAGALLPLGGPHRSGQVAVLREQSGKGSADPGGLATTGDVSRHVPYVGALTGVLGGAGEGIAAASENDTLMNRR